MVDLEKEKGNISLPPRLQSPDPKKYEREKKKKKHEVEPMIINMQKAFYDLKITEILKKIQRLQERNEELTNDQEGTALLLTTTDAETAEEIAQLTRQLFTEVSKLEELKDKLNALEKAILDDKAAHIEKVNSINNKYARKRLELVSQIKPINARTNVLEDYRKSQSILQQKLERINDFMLKEEEKVNQQISQINLKFKVDREKLKKDMYNHLLDLAGTFQLEISACIQEPVHKLIRENIILNTYLTQITNESLPKKKLYKKSKDMKKELLIENKLSYLTTKYNVEISKIQNHLLEALKEVRKDAKKYIASFNTLNIHDEANCSIEKDHAEAQVNDYELHVRQLELVLYKERVKLSATKYMQNKIQCKLKKCVETIYDIKYAVMCALQMTSSDPCLAQMDNKSLFLYLLDIILEGQTCMSNIRTKSVESIQQSTDVYAFGDLGFEPVSVELSAETLEEVRKSATPVSISIAQVSDEPIKGVPTEDKDSTVFEVIQEFTEPVYSDIRESIYGELEVTEMTNSEKSIETLET